MLHRSNAPTCARRHRRRRVAGTMVQLVELRVLLAVLTFTLAALHHQQQLLAASAWQWQEEEDESSDDGPKPKRRRTVVKRSDYRSLPWARMLEKVDLLSDPSTREAKQFRRRFRVPYPFFLDLVQDVKAGNWAGFTTDEFELGGRGTRRCIPVEIKVRWASKVGASRITCCCVYSK